MHKCCFYILLFFSCLFFQKAFSQQPGNAKDSLFQAIQSQKDDSTKVESLLLYGEYFETTNADSADHYYENAKQLSEKLNYKKGIATYISYKIVLLNNKGDFLQALKLNLQALQIFKEVHSEKDMAVAYNNLAASYEHLGNLKYAVESYISAYQLINKIPQKTHKDSVLLSVFTNNIGSVFAELNQYQKGYAYVTRAHEIALSLQNDQRIASSLVNLANYQTMMGNLKLAFENCKKIEMLSKKLDDYTYLLDAKLTEGTILNKQKDFEKATTAFQTVIQIAQKRKDPEYELNGWQGMAKTYLELRQFNDANVAASKAIDLARKIGDQTSLKNLYLLISEIKEQNNELAGALDFRKKYASLNDSLLGNQTRQDINMLDIKFQTQQKEEEIRSKTLLLEKNKELIHKKNTLNILLVFGIAMLLVIALLVFRNFKTKNHLLKQQQEIQSEKISRLEKEHQLLAMQSVIQGQEQERTRLARDLHDGVGGLLSGVKLSMSTMKGNVFLSEENVHAFNNVIAQLDQSIAELRRVSHNMMPEALVKYGLKEAMENYCANITQSGHLQVQLQSYGMEKRLDQNTEIILYRIIQELLNNIIKHADAKNVLIQLVNEVDRLNLTVEDDGKGFDQNDPTINTGAGLANIKARVEYLKGNLDIVSKPGEGTSVNISISNDQ